MRLSVLLSIVLVRALVAVSVPPILEPDQGLLQLSREDSARIDELIQAGDYPEALAEVVGEHRIAWTDIKDHIGSITRRNCFRSFEYLLPRIQFEAGEKSHRLSPLLLDALARHQPEICDVLLSQDFDATHLANALYFPYTFWIERQLFRWTIEELVALVVRHPKLIGIIEPDSWEQCTDVERCLLMLNIMPHMKHVDQEIARRRRAHPENILRRLMHNDHLADEDMILVLTRLFQMGAPLNEEIIDDFYDAKPEYAETLQFLRDSLSSLDIKDPGELAK
jgi:hypothetical protein